MVHVVCLCKVAKSVLKQYVKKEKLIAYELQKGMVHGSTDTIKNVVGPCDLMNQEDKSLQDPHHSLSQMSISIWFS